MKILALILINTSEHKLRFFDEIRELSDPALDSNAADWLKAQKGSKDIIKIVHVTSVVPP